MKTTSKRKREPHALTLKQQKELAYIAETAPSKLAHYRKAYEGLSLRSAIVAKCLECTSCDIVAIRECSGTACPLLNVRPYQEVRK